MFPIRGRDKILTVRPHLRLAALHRLELGFCDITMLCIRHKRPFVVTRICLGPLKSALNTLALDR